MKVDEVNIKLSQLDVWILRDALKVFGHEGRSNSEEIKKLQVQFQAILETMLSE